VSCIVSLKDKDFSKMDISLIYGAVLFLCFTFSIQGEKRILLKDPDVIAERLNRIEQKVTILETENLQQKQTITKLETELLQQNQRVTILETDNLNQKQTVAFLKAENLQQKQNVTKLETDNLQQKQRVTILETNSLQQKQTVANLKAENLQLEQRLQQSSQLIQNLQSSVSKLQSMYSNIVTIRSSTSSLFSSIFVMFGGFVFQQTVGLHMGTNCDLLLAGSLLYFVRGRRHARSSQEKRKEASPVLSFHVPLYI
jgi:uncharacterized protein YlxP (DUF503 family)